MTSTKYTVVIDQPGMQPFIATFESEKGTREIEDMVFDAIASSSPFRLRDLADGGAWKCIRPMPGSIAMVLTKDQFDERMQRIAQQREASAAMRNLVAPQLVAPPTLGRR